MKIKLRSNYDNFPEKYGKSDKQVNFYVDNYVPKPQKTAQQATDLKDVAKGLFKKLF